MNSDQLRIVTEFCAGAFQSKATGDWKERKKESRRQSVYLCCTCVNNLLGHWSNQHETTSRYSIYTQIAILLNGNKLLSPGQHPYRIPWKRHLRNGHSTAIWPFHVASVRPSFSIMLVHLSLPLSFLYIYFNSFWRLCSSSRRFLLFTLSLRFAPS